MQPSFPRVNFIGNKDKIASWICDNFPADSRTVFDAFSGGCSLAFEAKKRGYRVLANDALRINYQISKALIENKNITLSNDDVEKIFAGKPLKGYMYKNHSNAFFFPEECMELDRYRENIRSISDPYKQALAFTLMRRAMIRKMPYSRFNIKWQKVKQLRDEEYSYEKYGRKRAYHNQSFRFHFEKNLESYSSAVFDNGQDNKALNLDVLNAVRKNQADILYLDPPYPSTMNNYFGFYGLLDEYISSRKPKSFKNDFTNKQDFIKLFHTLFDQSSHYKFWFISYNNSSYPSLEKLVDVIKRHRKRVVVFERPHVYKITGKQRKKENLEYLLYAS